MWNIVRDHAVTWGHLRSPAGTCGHCKWPQMTDLTYLVKEVTCGHLRPLAATCGLLLSCSHSSGCKWLQVTAFSKINFRASSVLNGNSCKNWEKLVMVYRFTMVYHIRFLSTHLTRVTSLGQGAPMRCSRWERGHCWRAPSLLGSPRPFSQPLRHPFQATFRPGAATKSRRRVRYLAQFFLG
jgi:hypothetical protein